MDDEEILKLWDNFTVEARTKRTPQIDLSSAIIRLYRMAVMETEKRCLETAKKHMDLLHMEETKRRLDEVEEARKEQTEVLLAFCKRIIAKDKTPTYSYTSKNGKIKECVGAYDNEGNLPDDCGASWKTPREMAEQITNQIEHVRANKKKEDRVHPFLAKKRLPRKER